MATMVYKRVSTVDQKTERLQLQAMVAYVREGDKIYIHSLDRLARNNSDLQNLVNVH